MNTREKIKTLFMNLDVIVAGVNLVVLVALTFLGVIFRYVLSNPISWVEEVQSSCVVWVVFGAAGAAFRTGNHVAIEIFVDTLPKWLSRAIQLVIDVLFVAIMAYFLVQSVRYINFFVVNGRVSNLLKLPYKYVYMIAPVSCVLMIANYLACRIESSKSARGQEEAENE